MTKNSREFQVFIKPAGAKCNLRCRYCYYLEKDNLYKTFPAIAEGNDSEFNGVGNRTIMSDELLEKYISQHIKASDGASVNFSWHGGEPTLAGIDFYKRAIELQKKHKPSYKKIINGIQTNGTLLDEEWYKFLEKEKFIVGISIDGPEDFHDRYRLTSTGNPTFSKVRESFIQLKNYNIVTEVLCVVHAGNMDHPMDVYRFFNENGAAFITFLPLVIRDNHSESGVTASSVSAEGFGRFMVSVFDEWVTSDIGKIKVQLFEEAARTAFKQGHTLCIFREECGGVPVVEHNGDFYSCDHYVDHEHLIGNINNTDLAKLLDSTRQKAFGRAKRETLPRYCLNCEVRSMCNGECPKNRFILTPEGERGLNYLCSGYRKFFNHCKPWVEAVAEAWRLKNYQTLQTGIQAKSAAQSPNQARSVIQSQNQVRSVIQPQSSSQGERKKINRNEPCPCGSGKKYKHCCLNN